MKPVVHAVLVLVYAFALLVPMLYIAAWAIEVGYEVPLEPSSFRFERPLAVVLFAAPIWVYVSHLLLRSEAPRIQVSRLHDLRQVVSKPTFRQWLSPMLPALRIATLSLVTLGLMGPQSIHARDDAEVQGIDIVLAIDCSLSMQAGDILPNRFEAMKSVVDSFIRRRPNDRIGAVVFGPEAYTLLPLTTDKEALRSMIQELELGFIAGDGTAIGNALGVALNRLRNSTAESRVVILLTDGESNSGNLSPQQAAEFASTMGVKVYTVLMGQSANAPVQTGTDQVGRPVFDRGEFPINPDLMRSIARQTGGEGFIVSDREALERSFHSILDSLERSVIEDTGRVYGDLFPAFVWPALALFVLELLMGTFVLRRSP